VERIAAVWERKGRLYVTWSAPTTSGVWLQQGVEGPFDAAMSAEALGRQVLDALGQWNGQRLPHPSDDGWSLFDPPLWAASGVRSLRTFGRKVDVSAKGGLIEVTEWVHDERRRDTFVPGSRSAELPSPTPAELGTAIHALLGSPAST
jgi:hypothetical protein